jgi:membrane-bound inhibitor of C-type lysozyme
LVPRTLIIGFAVLFTGCNEIRYQSARLRAKSPALEVPKAASLPDRRVTFECGDGEPFEVFFTPGGGAAVLSLGGDEFALPELSAIAGRRYGDGRYELSFKEDGVAAVTFDDKLIRGRCKRR